MLKPPSRAEVIAFAALVVAMSGSGYAAVQLGKGSVTAREIRDGEVKARELDEGAVTTRSISPGAVWPGQFAENSVAGGAIEPGGLGWDRLSQKVNSDLASLVLWKLSRVAKSDRILANKDWELSVGCGTAKLLGGGFEVSPGVAVLRSAIGRDLDLWIVRGRTGATNEDVTVFASCLRP